MKEENGVANEADDKVVEGTDTADFAAIAKVSEFRPRKIDRIYTAESNTYSCP